MLYALKLKETGKFVGFDVSSNYNSDFCVEESYELCEYSDKIWVTPLKEIAEHVANSTTKYYNADFTSPINKYAGKLDVVQLM